LPKVKSGGILAGDDYSPVWDGVRQAVNGLLTDVRVDDTTWIYVKP
jgi:hypothetical protein